MAAFFLGFWSWSLSHFHHVLVCERLAQHAEGQGVWICVPVGGEVVVVGLHGGVSIHLTDLNRIVGTFCIYTWFPQLQWEQGAVNKCTRISANVVLSWWMLQCSQELEASAWMLLPLRGAWPPQSPRELWKHWTDWNLGIWIMYHCGLVRAVWQNFDFKGKTWDWWRVWVWLFLVINLL